MVPNGSRMMHYTKQHTKPNCSPWHFWMDITAHQLLWLRPSITFNDELSSNLRSRTSRTYIHWWSKRTWNRFSLGFFTNMHIHFDNNVVLWSSLYQDWTSLQTPVIQEIHQMVKYNNTARPSKKSHSHMHSCLSSCCIFHHTLSTLHFPSLVCSTLRQLYSLNTESSWLKSAVSTESWSTHPNALLCRPF